MAPTISELAAHLGCEYTGPETRIEDVAALDAAGPNELAFSVYEDRSIIESADAGAIICPGSVPPVDDKALVFAPDPKLAYTRVVSEFFENGRSDGGNHPDAVVEPGAVVGDGTRIGAGAYVADCVRIGENCTIRSGAVLGCDGFGFVRDGDGTPHRMPHQGGVRIGDNVEIGANSTVDRAVFDETVVGDHTKLSANVHLAHGVEIGRGSFLSYHCGLAGSVTVGDDVMGHPNVAVATDVTVADSAELGMNAAVLDDVPRGATVVGSPARVVD